MNHGISILYIIGTEWEEAIAASSPIMCEQTLKLLRFHVSQRDLIKKPICPQDVSQNYFMEILQSTSRETNHGEINVLL